MPSDRLRQAWPLIITEPYEDRSVEYKQSASWETLKYHIVKTALALANLRDGGFVVVGVRSAEGGRLEAEGMQTEHLGSFDYDTVHSFINNYAEPAVSVRAELMVHEDRQYYIIEVSQFEAVPVIAIRGTPHTEHNGVRVGTIYARPIGKAETRPATAADLREILELAIDTGVRQFMERIRRAGVEMPSAGPSDAEQYAKERGDL